MEAVEVGERVSPLLSVAIQAAPVLTLGLIALGLGVILWARLDDHRRGLR